MTQMRTILPVRFGPTADRNRRSSRKRNAKLTYSKTVNAYAWYLPRPLVPAAARSAWALEHKPATADKPESTALRCHKASYGPAPDPVFLAADGVTWRAVWEPQAEAPAGKANGAGRVAAGGDPSLEQLPE